jgi:hypothetical protein
MRTKLLLSFIILLLQHSISYSQTGSDIEHDFISLRKVVVGIGTVINDSILKNGKTEVVKRYVTLGSGFITYVRVDSTVINSVITARHVIDFFTDRKLKSIFIRPSWADTIKTTDYFGIEIPLINPDGVPNIYLYPEKQVDLGCILMSGIYYDKVAIDKFNSGENVIFPINNMTTPYIGNQVWICGYPGHIQSNMESRFHYSICTFKPGYVAWKPSPSITNRDLNHITLVESNASYGNSGGPVFALNEKIEFVGILVGGYDELEEVYLNGKLVIDPDTKDTLKAKSRSGVSIIEKAEYVRNLIQDVQLKLSKYLK